MRTRIGSYRLAPWAFLALPLAMYLVWVVIPIAQSMVFAFSKKDSIVFGIIFVGLRNFARLLQDDQFWLALKNNSLWLVFFVLIPVPLGLAVAMLFDGKRRGTRAFKTLFYLPMTPKFSAKL